MGPLVPEQPPRRASSRLPLITLASTVVLAVALPLAAATARTVDTVPAAPGGPGAGATGTSSSASSAPEPASPSAHPGPSAPSPRTGPGCGPQLTSPDGVEAQTCVMREGEETWARSYYRNATNTPLHAVLTLLRPDGGSVRASCAMPPGEGPGVCETPHEKRAADVQRAYSAMAEIGDRAGERMLLRAGSNSPAR